jgi:hypothetical protein
LITAVTDTGTRINIQQTVDTALVVSKSALQGGGILLCQSASGSGRAFTCQMAPTLTAYAIGMVLYWRPDVNGTGGATTLNIDQLGAVPVVKADGSTAPGSADIVAGQLYLIWNDGAVFRVLSTGGTSSSSGTGTSAPPAAITSTGAGGVTAVTATTEWHGPLAFCSGPSNAALAWNPPPAGSTTATADGCAGTNVSDGFAAFTVGGSPSVQTSFVLPTTLTGKADVFLTYLSPTAGGTFTPALDAVCTPADGSTGDDPVFAANSFFAPGAVAAPLTANMLATVSQTGLTWPASCAAGSRAHLRLSRTDTNGSAAKVDVAEVVVVMRRTL